MESMKKAHDKYYKETFGNVAIAGEFIQKHLPKSITDLIEMHTLEVQKDSFIDQEMEEIHADLLFKARVNKEEGYIYFLFEHKSYKDKSTALQLLKYMVGIWESKLRKEKLESLPLIIPLVIYHGEEKWEIKTQLGDWIGGYEELPGEVKKYVPDYQYLLYDFSQYGDEEIEDITMLNLTIRMLRDIRKARPEELVVALMGSYTLLKEMAEESAVICYLETSLLYLMGSREDLDEGTLLEAAKRISKEGGELAMTLVEKLEARGMQKGLQMGRQEGLQEGLQKGLQEGKREIAAKLLKSMNVEAVAQITGLTLEEVRSLLA